MSVNNNFFRQVGAAIVCAASLMSAASQAAWVTVQGDNFSISYDDEALGAYGASMIVGDSVVYAPTEMSVYSSYGAVSESFTTSFVINPNEGVSLDSLGLSESGTYSVVANDGGSDEVAFSIQSRLFIASLEDPNSNFDFLSSGLTFASDEEADQANWQFDDSFSTEAFADGFLLTVQNTLEIFTELCDFHAFIDKSNVTIDFGSDGGPSPVPLPAGMWLFGAALMSMTAMRRRV